LFAATIIAAVICGIVGMLGFVFFHSSSAFPATVWRH
jgi:hypothetical protein